MYQFTVVVRPNSNHRFELLLNTYAVDGWELVHVFKDDSVLFKKQLGNLSSDDDQQKKSTSIEKVCENCSHFTQVKETGICGINRWVVKPSDTCKDWTKK